MHLILCIYLFNVNIATKEREEYFFTTQHKYYAKIIIYEIKRKQ